MSLLIIGIISLSIIFIGFIVFVKASASQDQSQNQSLQDELNSLEQNLSDSGYSWLTNYTLLPSEQGVSQIGVYRPDSNIEIARFTNVTTAGYYRILLTNLSDNESYDGFDLKVIGSPSSVVGGNETTNNSQQTTYSSLGGVDFDYVVDPSQMNLTTGQVLWLHLDNNSAIGENATKVV